jgi:formylglycine-generating enzyme required for sulfatase activity
MVGASWYAAAAYCNWLGKQEGVPQDQWCYEPNTSGQYVEGMKPATDFLQRTGYRLPTEAEWEYACRSGAATSRYYGETWELLGKYAWYLENSKNRSWPVGSLKPNDFGLSDMLGNVFQWCQDAYHVYSLPAGGGVVEDLGDAAAATDKISRVIRGVTFLDQPCFIRSARRIWNLPQRHNYATGFRVARTYN